MNYTACMDKIMVGWTTTPTEDEAERIARTLIEQRMAASVQVDGPIISHYRWEDKIQRNSEYRLKIKFPAIKENEIKKWLKANHSYKVSQWIAMEASSLPDYLNWAVQTTTTEIEL